MPHHSTASSRLDRNRNPSGAEVQGNAQSIPASSCDPCAVLDSALQITIKHGTSSAKEGAAIRHYRALQSFGSTASQLEKPSSAITK